MARHRPPGDSADKRQPAAAFGQPATLELIYGSLTKGVKGGKWRLDKVRAGPERSAAPGARAPLTERRRYGSTCWRPFRARVGHGLDRKPSI